MKSVTTEARAIRVPPHVVRYSGEPCGPGAFAVQSAANPDLAWYVEWQNAAVRWCACARFTNKNTCRHTEAVTVLWREEHEAALAARRADPATVAATNERIKQLRETFQ